jgi:hypothetical protein
MKFYSALAVAAKQKPRRMDSGGAMESGIPIHTDGLEIRFA